MSFLIIYQLTSKARPNETSNAGPRAVLPVGGNFVYFSINF